MQVHGLGVRESLNCSFLGQFLRLFSFYPKVLKLWEPAAGSTDDISKRRPASAQLRVVIWYTFHMLVRYTFYRSRCKCLLDLSLKFHVQMMLLDFNTMLVCRMTIYATYHAQIKKCLAPLLHVSKE
ncbi:unnamed protein product [Triticum turgidum subsp. durum]|uniref:Uncharacterized protein n=1 Tax=Triticum turgidum subsp. durum TaxID=4567 RepID=A0A9R1AVV6_TRITD|nr:unnamed protein product [Triticum turgidum subsp. durum]